jgi:hypothetical protein
MAMWGGLQKVSRPIDWCQEMSQCTPTTAEVTAPSALQIGQGIEEIDDWVIDD